MKYFQSLFFLILLIISQECFAGVKILEWNENSTLTNFGRSSKISIKLQAINLPANTGLSSFSINSTSKRNLEIKNVKVNAIAARYLNSDGLIEFFFKDLLKNNQIAILEFESNDFYKVTKYIRQEHFYIPEFASGASADLQLNISDNYDLISSHPQLNITNNIVYIKTTVPKNGISEILKLTNKKVTWDVSIRSIIKLENPSGAIEVTAPYLFRGGNQKVENQTIGASIQPTKHLTTRQNDILTFEVTPEISEINIFNKAKITVGSNIPNENFRLTTDQYLEISPQQQQLLAPLLRQIINDPKYQDMPLYAKIVNFVSSYIQYDLSYFAKLLTVEEILATKKGVCSEFATLFNALARAAKIPSSIVHGYAWGEYDKFEPHAWNMIFVNNKWIYVDPTWNLSAGNVSSSHIYIKDNRKEEILLKYEGKDSKIEIDRDFKIKALES